MPRLSRLSHIDISGRRGMSPAYRDFLDGECRRTFHRLPRPGTLHVGSEVLLDALRTAQKKGVLVFFVESALAPENVAWVRQTSRSLGFAPFAGARDLERAVEPFSGPQATNGERSRAG